jgi:hypothetical protein
MVAFMFEITRIHNDVEWCIELMSMQASVLVSASCSSPSTCDGLLLLSTHKDDTQEESESHEIIDSIGNKLLKHLNAA